MEDMTLCAPEHREVFQRVWRRVMEGRSPENCPVELTVETDHMGETRGEGRGVRDAGDGDMDCLRLAALAQAAEASPPRDSRGTDLPAAGEEPAPPDECTARLRQQVMDALEGWQFYRHLARRARGTPARTLTDLAADQHRQARRLSAAYFLLTGLRYWPSEQLSTPVISSFWGALRQRHQAERQTELACKLAAEDLDDATLRELYRDLEADCQSHCRQLRAMLEQSCP